MEINNNYHPRKQGLGEVYFIQVGDYYKIGATRDLYKRFNTIQTCNATQCTLIHRVMTNDMYLTERLFKAMFERLDGLIRGEWFSLSNADVDYIKTGKYSTSIANSIGNTTLQREGFELIGKLLTA